MSEVGQRFEPLARQTLSAEIRNQLQRTIEDGTLPPGSRLSSERELCEQFGVARTSVREAIQGLISLGLVERRGNRTFVAEELPGVMPDLVDGRKVRVQELFEVRRLIELPMVKLAACRATTLERAEISTIAKEFTPDLEILEFRRLDRAFHWALARSSHNALLTEIYGKVLEALFGSGEFEAMLGSIQNATAVRRLITQSGKEHRQIADALLRGETVSVVDESEAHLHRVEDQLISKLV